MPKMLERDAELERMMHFFQKCIDREQGSCLYIEGGPGSGKTLAMSFIQSELVQLFEQVSS